ncbi:sulfotransferase [Thiohalomonas denitrificans]|uniref:sulfotransferase n=1 Tax=Thiohalomonas denitrificans TaxID=415747 RepID=UPI001585DFEA|nr:sulfotransferase [Thiohalomonas denitrificans]
MNAITMDIKQSTPIIFVGMHRSGTSLLGQLLEQLGLFVGKEKDENNESLFFQELNTWLMVQCGTRWDNPEPVADLWSDEARPVLDASLKYASDLMSSPRSARHLGIERYLKHRSIFRFTDPWGWKDPRNTLTLPFWLELFPDARVIFIERHGVDVAESLRVRSSRTIETARRRYERKKSIAWLRQKRGVFCESPRCLSLEGGFSLWETYQVSARRHLATLSGNQLFRVRYEELLDRPLAVVKEVAEFCALPVTDSRAREITASINPSRAYSFRDQAELVHFAKERQERLNVWDYGL